MPFPELGSRWLGLGLCFVLIGCAESETSATEAVDSFSGETGVSEGDSDVVVSVDVGQNDEADPVDLKDDVYFFTLAELDEVPYVGPKAFEQLLAHATRSGVTCGDAMEQYFMKHSPVKPPALDRVTYRLPE